MANKLKWNETSEKDTEEKENKPDATSKTLIVEYDDKRIETFIQQNSPINNEMIRNSVVNDLIPTDIDGQMSIIPTEVTTRAKKGKLAPVVTLCSFSYDNNTDIEIMTTKRGNKITAYDRRVYNAVSTLYLNGRKTVSIAEIYAVMTGYIRANPPKTTRDTIEQSLRKLSSINVFIDLTNEMNANMIKDKEPLIKAGILSDNNDKMKKVSLEDKMIHIKIGTLESESGKVFKSIQIINEPTLLTYNRAKKTLISIPMNYIGLTNSNTTERTIAFQDYLLLRIINYKNGKMKENKILYDTIYKESGIDKPSTKKDETDRKGVKRDRETILKMMDEWKQNGLISNYYEFKSNKTIKGLVFEIPGMEPKKIEEQNI